jgi:2-dehydro-3-deoxyphosphooctonate aldolase (KDO 8-P synthase)
MRLGRLILIAGPCVIESKEMCFEIARTLSEICGQLGITYVFKASYDKANRTSGDSFRGLGLDEWLKILARIRKTGVPVLTDVHSSAQAFVALESFLKVWAAV